MRGRITDPSVARAIRMTKARAAVSATVQRTYKELGLTSAELTKVLLDELGKWNDLELQAETFGKPGGTEEVKSDR